MSDVERLLPVPPAERGVFANRTLNLRAIRAIGYDMDYTLVHYDVRRWEDRAYEFMKRALVERGFPVEELRFDASLVIRGLCLDTHLGNLVKANRFGYVKRAFHGSKVMGFDEQRKAYSQVMVELAEPRWVFLNTLFSLSEACMYAQLVDLLDAGTLPGALGYTDLHGCVRSSLDATHAEGVLKAEIMAAPEHFVERDAATARTLLDQKQAGKQLLVITNSEWSYTSAMMKHAFDPYLPGSMTWRDLFDLVIVGSRKPQFFSERAPAFEVVNGDVAGEEGLLRPVVGPLQLGRAYLGGHAGLVEQCLGLSGHEILYVGDHVYGDVHVSKNLLRWRTALVLRELEGEVVALADNTEARAQLAKWMHEKEELERRHAQLRLALLRADHGVALPDGLSRSAVKDEITTSRERLTSLDATIGPLAKSQGEVDNPHWGPLMRTGNDKSLLTRMVERSADVYTSRVSNFEMVTPFGYLRSRHGELPHDP